MLDISYISMITAFFILSFLYAVIAFKHLKTLRLPESEDQKTTA